MPISLPCKLAIPESDLVTNGTSLLSDPSSPQAAASCNVLFLHTVDTESLTGPQAIRKALGVTLALRPGPIALLVHFKVTPQGITLTDKQHKLFFRRHYPQANISHCGLDPDNRQWAFHDPETGASTSGRCFGFVARKPGSRTDNQCHLFVELDPSQPASAIVSFIAKTSLFLRSTPL
ncbi:TNS3 [Cordylochernes scorpioides]|uniref:TNS3 n=1 Tax=Cordylochernes scorpioides TaxID=51811 RepID=A0ABY6L7F1_9ARAC|nr:TNS3 [Cordylochernes scorpioides]